MCDDSGTIYAGDDETIVIDLDGMDLSGMGLDGIIDSISLSPDDLDEQTKRELLINGFNPPAAPDPKCRWCKGTGKVKLLVSDSDCDCVTKPLDGSRHRV